MRYAIVCLWIGALGLAGCGGSDGAGAPLAPEPPGPDLSGHAFQLTIDARTGEIEVAEPRVASAREAGSRPSSIRR